MGYQANIWFIITVWFVPHFPPPIFDHTRTFPNALNLFMQIYCYDPSPGKSFPTEAE